MFMKMLQTFQKHSLLTITGLCHSHNWQSQKILLTLFKMTFGEIHTPVALQHPTATVSPRSALLIFTTSLRFSFRLSGELLRHLFIGSPVSSMLNHNFSGVSWIPKFCVISPIRPKDSSTTFLFIPSTLAFDNFSRVPRGTTLYSVRRQWSSLHRLLIVSPWTLWNSFFCKDECSQTL